MTSSRQVLVLALALLIISVLAVFGLNYTKNMQKVKPESTAYETTFSIEGAHLKRFNEQGYLEATVQAKELEHYRDINLTTFEQPVMSFTEDTNKGTWIANADKGLLNHDNNTILLEFNVCLSSHSNQFPYSQLFTESMEINYTTQTAHSSSKIHIIGENYTLDGKGLIANLKTAYIEILEQVQGYYETE